MSPQDTGNSPRQVKPSNKCAIWLDGMGLDPNIVPDYDSVLEFTKEVKKKIPSMNQEQMACVQRQMQLMKRNAGSNDHPAKIVLKQEMPNILDKIAKQTKRLESGKSGRMKMGAPRDFKFIG